MFAPSMLFTCLSSGQQKVGDDFLNHFQQEIKVWVLYEDCSIAPIKNVSEDKWYIPGTEAF